MMRLELASFTVRDVRFADRTRFEDGVLSLAREELRQLVLRGDGFADVAVEIVRPGDDVRLIHVMDAVEPRYKPGPGSTFPGFVGPPKTVGDGRTHRLDGMAIVSVGEAVAGEPTHWREAIVDMAGPGARATPFGSTINLVLDFKPRDEDLNADRPEAALLNLQLGSTIAQRYNRSVRAAQLRVAEYLAKTTAELEPDDVQVHELAPTAASLPRVVYFLQWDGFVYGTWGDYFGSTLPSLLHPNEVLDGALVNMLSIRHASVRYSTFLLQHHTIVRELARRHGTDLSFVGVILYAAGAFELEKKEMVAEYAVKLAKLVGAEGACSSYVGGGNPCVDFMLVCQKCEQAGIQTVQVMPELYGTPEDPGFVDYVPEAVAIVSTGRSTQSIELPAVARAIGGKHLFDLDGAPTGALSIPYRYLYASSTSVGYGQLAARQY